MPYKLNGKPNTSLSLLPLKTQGLTDMLLSVDWRSIDFDSLNDDEIEEPVNLIVENIPEWQRLVHCKQHPTHDYDLGVHTLLALQKVQEMEEYSQLEDYNRLVLVYTILLHDIEKVEKVVDPDHPDKGARTAQLVLTRLGFDTDFVDDVCILIKNHQILGLIANEWLNMPIPELLTTLGKPYLFDLLAMLAIADIKSVKKNEAYFSEKVGKNIKTIREEVKKLIKLPY